MSDRLIAIFGATATGKTALAVEVAKKVNGTILNCDSMQIYKKMSIGTAKPTLSELDGIECRLIDFVEPDGEYNVLMFKNDAEREILNIQKSKKVPVLCGGTGFYIDTLLDNTELSIDSKDEEISVSLNRDREEFGNDALYERLKSVDPKSAEKIHKNDSKRIIRALEIYLVTGKTRSEWGAISQLSPKKYDAVKILVSYSDRSKLYKRINDRVDIMFEAGLVDEAKYIYDNYDRSKIAAIGYPQLFEYFDGLVSLEEAKENVKRFSRNYAKRQQTWFRRVNDAKVLFADQMSGDEMVKEVVDAFLA